MISLMGSMVASMVVLGVLVIAVALPKSATKSGSLSKT